MNFLSSFPVAITATGYVLVGLPAYLAYPNSVKSNVLDTFPHDDTLIQIVRAIVGVVEIASYPVNHLPARQAIKDGFSTATGVQLGGKAFIITETLVFYIGTLVLALVVQDVGSVFAVTGGVCGSAIILGMPGLLLIQYSWKKQRDSRLDSNPREVASFPLFSSLLEEGGDGDEEQEEERVQYRHRHAAQSSSLRNNNNFTRYSAWTSKLFWSGVVLVVSCVSLIVYTIAATVLQSKNVN